MSTVSVMYICMFCVLGSFIISGVVWGIVYFRRVDLVVVGFADLDGLWAPIRKLRAWSKVGLLVYCQLQGPAI